MKNKTNAHKPLEEVHMVIKNKTTQSKEKQNNNLLNESHNTIMNESFIKKSDCNSDDFRSFQKYIEYIAENLDKSIKSEYLDKYLNKYKYKYKYK